MKKKLVFLRYVPSAIQETSLFKLALIGKIPFSAIRVEGCVLLPGVHLTYQGSYLHIERIQSHDLRQNPVFAKPGLKFLHGGNSRSWPNPPINSSYFSLRKECAGRSAIPPFKANPS